jgi:hypothetical protein
MSCQINTASKVISLIWEHTSTSENHLQASSAKYVEGIVHDRIKFSVEVPIVQSDETDVALSYHLFSIKEKFKRSECFNDKTFLPSLLLLQSVLQTLVDFGLLYDFVPQSSIFTLLSPVTQFHLL